MTIERSHLSYLETTLGDLLASGFRAGVETAPFGVRVWLFTDAGDGRLEHLATNAAGAATWLIETALTRYPTSEFAKARGVDQPKEAPVGEAPK